MGPWAHHGFHLLREKYLKPSSKGINAIIINFKAIGHMFSAIPRSELFIGTLWLHVRIYRWRSSLPPLRIIMDHHRHVHLCHNSLWIPNMPQASSYASHQHRLGITTTSTCCWCLLLHQDLDLDSQYCRQQWAANARSTHHFNTKNVSRFQVLFYFSNFFRIDTPNVS